MAGEVANAVFHALKSGYRHIDCALVYGNESEVGQGLAKAFKEGICKREDVFVTTKLWNTYHRKVAQGMDESLKSLGLDYVDLYLMHWPISMNPNGNHPLFPKHPDGSRDLDLEFKHTETWKEMEKLVSAGKTKAIGCSNYSVKFLKELLPVATIKPAVDQVEIHPYLPQDDIVQFCKENGIVVTAYSPFGSSNTPLFKDEDVVKIAEKYGVPPGTVLVSFACRFLASDPIGPRTELVMQWLAASLLFPRQPRQLELKKICVQ